MTVSIDIDLDALAAKMEIGQLRLMLESLGDDVDFDLDLDGDLGDTLENLSDTMEEISESFSSDMDETITRLENLEFDDINMVSRGDGDSGGDTGSDSGDETNRSKLSNLFEAFDRSTEEIRGRMGVGREESNSLSERKQRAFDILNREGNFDVSSVSRSTAKLDDEATSRLQRQINSAFGDDFGFRIDKTTTNGMRDEGIAGLWGDTENGKVSFGKHFDGRDLDFDYESGMGSRSKRGGPFGLLVRRLTTVSELTGDLKKGFRKAIPSMTTWMNLIGMAVPALGAFVVQAAGVAAAMGSIALAGGAMIGLGLIGHGDSMAESFRNAGNEVDDLKQGLFDAFEPAADLFAPTQSEFFDFIPGEMDRVQQSMQGLLVFKQDFFDMFRGLTEFTAEFFNLLASNSDKIGQMNERFSKIIGSSILNFFNWLLETGFKNQEMLIELGVALKRFAITLYNLFLIVGKVVQMLSGLFKILVFLSNILNNKLFAGMIAIVAVMYMVSSVVGLVTGSMGMLATVLSTGLIPLFSAMFTYLQAHIFQAILATVANYGLAHSIATVTAALGTLMAMSGIGLLIGGLGLGIGKMSGMLDMGASGGDYERSNGGSSGGGTTIHEGDTVNVDMGNADNATMEKFSDMRGGGGTRGPTGGSYT